MYSTMQSRNRFSSLNGNTDGIQVYLVKFYLNNFQATIWGMKNYDKNKNIKTGEIQEFMN